MVFHEMYDQLFWLSMEFSMKEIHTTDRTLTDTTSLRSDTVYSTHSFIPNYLLRFQHWPGTSLAVKI